MLSFLAPFLISTFALTADVVPQTEPAPIAQEEIVEIEDQTEILDDLIVCEKCPKKRIEKN